MRTRILTVLFILLLAGASLGAQELVFFEGDVTISEIVDEGAPFVYRTEDIYFGFQLGPDFIIETGPHSYAEIVLPNGHVLKMADDTEIKLDTVVARAQSGSDQVSVARGRLRSVVANLTGTGRDFAVRTPTAVGGVRGTDFVTQVLLNAAGAVTEEAMGVLEGVVDFARNSGPQVSLGAGQFADALSANFQAQTGNIAGQFYGGLEQISEAAQRAADRIAAAIGTPPDADDGDGDEGDAGDGEPGDAGDDDTGEGDGTDDGDAGDGDAGEGEEPPADDPPATVQNAQPAVVTSQPDDDDTDEPVAVGGDEGGKPGPVDQFIADMTEVLGLEIGTITLGGNTYSKLVAQPTFQLGKLRAGLYLPVIYNGNLFDMGDWYEPKGNNEWSFGMDQDWRGDTLNAIGDLVGDLALKIKFLEWGQQRDPFFFKVGSLNTLTLGHGLLMRNYANDADFPAIRRIGFNLGVDMGRIGFEAIVNDLAEPEIFGSRLYFRPIKSFSLAVGLSGVVDIGPARDLPETLESGTAAFVDERAADPVFNNVALDLDLPILVRPAASLILYGDVGGLLPYLRAPYGAVAAGMQWDALWYDDGDGGQLRNYGIAAGLQGNVSAFDFMLEFRNYRGIFQPAFYDSNYDRLRAERAREVLAYLANPGDPVYANQTIGVFGEAGFTIADLVRLEAGYLWPWTQGADGIVMSPQDDLVASLYIKDGLLPMGITAGFSYERNYFVPTIAPSLFEEDYGSLQLFDENTVLRGEIVYPVAPIMDIVASVSTTILRDGNGAVQYTENADGTPGRPKYGPVINIETRLGPR